MPRDRSSNNKINNVPVKIILISSKKRTKALLIEALFILHFWVVASFPVASLTSDLIKVKSVVVLRPPAVEVGEPPINIKIIKIR